MRQDSNIQVNKLKTILMKHAAKEDRRNSATTVQYRYSDEDIDVLINELQVHRLEVEMQNDELKISYAALEAERQKLAGIYNLAPVGYFILDHMGFIEDINQTGIDLLNLDKGLAKSVRFQSFVVPEHLELFYGFLHKMHTVDNKQRVEIKLQWKDKSVFYARIEGVVIHSAIASQVKYYITVSDISENRAAEQSLRQSKEQLEMTLKASSTGIWTIVLGSGRIQFDEYSYSILDLKPWEFNETLKDFFQLVHPDDRALVKESYLSGMHTTKELNIEFRVVVKNGSVRYIAAKGRQIVLCEEHTYFSGIVMDISERKTLERESEMLKMDQQRHLLSATLNAQEKERNRISQALHDSICQLLYGIRLNLQSIPYYRKFIGEFKSVNSLLDQAIKETRQISYELAPSVLKDFGFTAGIKEMAQRTSTPNFHIKLDISDFADQLGQTVQLYVFRIIQELINNCMKHSNATDARVQVSVESDIVSIVVADNGVGFPVNLDEALLRGSGLRNIKNKVFLLRGNMKVQNKKRGTLVSVVFNKDIELSAEAN